MEMRRDSTFIHEDEEDFDGRTLKKYVPINCLYSATSPCLNPSGSSTVMSKKVKARKLRSSENGEEGEYGAENSKKNYELRKSARESGKSESVKRSLVSKKKRWIELDYESVDPNTFVGLACKVFWPLDEDWYKGSVTGYNSATKKHCIEYNDGDVEQLVLSAEKIKFHISSAEMQNLNLKYDLSSMEQNGLTYNEMLALATLDDNQSLEPGDTVWAKLTGHAMWPAVIVDESKFGARGGLQLHRKQAILVQFFGTHDFARINSKQAIPFVNGLISSLHTKCKQIRFFRGLEEANLYLSKHQLPESMMELQKNMRDNDCLRSSILKAEEEPCDNDMDSTMVKTVECGGSSPLEVGNLRVTCLGKIVCDSMHFHDKKHIWPEGYTAFRTFASTKDPNIEISYKMEVLRNPKAKHRPLFRVTSEDKEQIDGPNPAACWKKIYDRIRKNGKDNLNANAGCDLHCPGSEMFGFENIKITRLIQDLPNSRFCSKYFENRRDASYNYREVHVDWKDLDKCNVCNMDEEYEDNVFMQCDSCRIMVHTRCYGELEPLDGNLWFCKLCRPGAPESLPPCCLCPIIGGAMKPTTDGRWAHLACAVWIPETCLADVKKMEPIDGICRISKDRWKLVCSICGVAYGACIQCSNSTCRVAYHPLCARVAGLCAELEDEEAINLMSSVDDNDGQCIRLLSFCKKHIQPSNKCQQTDENLRLLDHCASNYVPPPNPSGCARSEPYSFVGRRGQREPEALAAASVKRLFIENTPHVVGGHYQNGNVSGSSSNESQCAKNMKTNHVSTSISSMVEKYEHMKATFRKRLVFGKSRIHGFGVFAKLSHKAGDMVIEYTGEMVRPSVADIREHCIYNSLVGAGTYMFRINNEHVVDATRAGSIAHLINHSCEPNCYSRTITINGEPHIIIFAKRDIKSWEEITYDYRFFSEDERLACFCGSKDCRGVVNDMDDQRAKIIVKQSDLTPCNGED